MALLAPTLARAEGAAPPPSADDVQFFEATIRPLLAEHCFSCHGPEKHKGKLRLDSAAALRAGGESGPALIAGHPEQSRIIKAVGYQDADLQMPPENRLPDRKVADLTRWVRRGAPWPADGKPAGGPLAGEKPAGEKPAEATDAAADRAWWAFQPIRRPATPSVRHGGDALANPIDAFVLARLEAEGLEPSPLADRRALIRRAAFDLTGLPPTPEEVEAFANDADPLAYEKLIDRLLARPQYGERWARHWLDVVRYAQTNGYERDGEKPYAWRFRDYVIRALNDDKPFDRFIVEQLAGDELDDATDDSRIATGFCRLGVHDDEPDDARAAEYDELDDVIRTTGTAFLGLTIGCARCHDHKFDPIPQADYYRFLSFFHNLRPYRTSKYGPDSSLVPLGDRAAVRQWLAGQEQTLGPLSERLDALQREGKAGGVEAKALAARAQAIKAQRPPFELALAARERGRAPVKTRVLARGNAALPGAEVEPAFPGALGGGKPAALASSDAQSSGLRRALAGWIASANNPLTARVIVNRVWQHHFGRGIVPTPDDFGKTGLPPTHPELLDYLAGRLVDSGWSLKKLHKLIMLSSAYRRSSSAAGNAKAAAADPANELLWRQNLRRLEAEALRDSVLAVAGTLDGRAGGRGFFPRPSREVIAGGSRPGDGWDVSPPAECARRSVYAYVKRSMLVPMLEAFDSNNTALPGGDRAVTTVAPQALMMLNDDFLHAQAEAFAARVRGEAGADRGRQATRAYQLALGRGPSDRERRIALAYLDRQAEQFKAVQSRLTFRPDVPSSLSGAYLSKLRPEDFLSGPRAGWAYGRGAWGMPYEGILILLDPATRGPYALDSAVTFADGTLAGRLLLRDGAGWAALIVRGRAQGVEEHTGYDVAFDPKGGAVSLQRHGPGARDVTTLATAAFDLAPGRWYAVRIEAAGARLRVWVEDGGVAADSGKEAGQAPRPAPLLDVTDPRPLTEAGSPGVRAWGDAVVVEDLAATFGGKAVPVRDGPADPARPERQALQSLCLLLFNLNEFVYVD